MSWGVIGLVIGGIWVAAASVNYKFKVNETATGVRMAIETIRKLHKGMPCTADVGIDPESIDLGPASKWPSAFAATGAAQSVQAPLGGGGVRFIIECNGGNPLIHVPMGVNLSGFSYSD